MPDQAETLAAKYFGREVLPLNKLTPHETEILMLYHNGLSTTEIADQLNKSPNQVKSIRRNARNKCIGLGFRPQRLKGRELTSALYEFAQQKNLFPESDST